MVWRIPISNQQDAQPARQNIKCKVIDSFRLNSKKGLLAPSRSNPTTHNYNGNPSPASPQHWYVLPTAVQEDELTLPARAQAPGGARHSLQWDNGLANDAQNYANHLASIGKMEHSQNRNGQGENLYASTGTPSFADASKSWTDERPQYNGGKIGEISNFSAVGHYTQCVWPETTKLGMGIAKGQERMDVHCGTVLASGKYEWAVGMAAGSGCVEW